MGFRTSAGPYGGWLPKRVDRPTLACPSASAHEAIPVELNEEDSLNNLAAQRRTLYPEIEPYSRGNLRLDSVHTMYWEQSGNPDGYREASAGG